MNLHCLNAKLELQKNARIVNVHKGPRTRQADSNAEVDKLAKRSQLEYAVYLK